MISRYFKKCREYVKVHISEIVPQSLCFELYRRPVPVLETEAIGFGIFKASKTCSFEHEEPHLVLMKVGAEEHIHMMDFTSAPSTTVVPNDDHAGFETMVSNKRVQRRLKKDKRNRNPTISRSSSHPTQSSSFGRASWVKPKRLAESESDVCGTHSKEYLAASSSIPNRDERESSPSEHSAVVEGQAMPLSDPTNCGFQGSNVLNFQESAASRPLSEMLAAYGEQDLEWQKVVPIAKDTPSVNEASTIDVVSSAQGGQEVVPESTINESRLGPHGKAPVHVEFVSFGYRHGAPVELRNSWSHAHPLPAWDTRGSITAQVPPYLAWQDGLSGAVRRALLLADGSNIRSLAKHIADQVATALAFAMNEGGHGYAFPLNVKVFVGSEMGRHRSVVVAEMVATALRGLLRVNAKNLFACPCSVGLRHRDLERKPPQTTSNTRPKHNDMEDD